MAGVHRLPGPLADGYRRFRSDSRAAERARLHELATDGQRPVAIVIACADSRSAPEVVFDARPGDLFVVRNIAALVPPFEPDGRHHAASAALEFAVRVLEVPSVVVMGHAGCGGVRAAIDPAPAAGATDFIDAWVADIRSLVRDGDDVDASSVERRSVERSIANLATFPWIAAGVAEGRLAVHGTWFDIGSGDLHLFDGEGWGPVSRRA